MRGRREKSRLFLFFPSAAGTAQLSVGREPYVACPLRMVSAPKGRHHQRMV